MAPLTILSQQKINSSGSPVSLSAPLLGSIPTTRVPAPLSSRPAAPIKLNKLGEIQSGLPSARNISAFFDAVYSKVQTNVEKRNRQAAQEAEINTKNQINAAMYQGTDPIMGRVGKSYLDSYKQSQDALKAKIFEDGQKLNPQARMFYTASISDYYNQTSMTLAKRNIKAGEEYDRHMVAADSAQAILDVAVNKLDPSEAIKVMAKHMTVLGATYSDFPDKAAMEQQRFFEAATTGLVNNLTSDVKNILANANTDNYKNQFTMAQGSIKAADSFVKFAAVKAGMDPNKIATMRTQVAAAKNSLFSTREALGDLGTKAQKARISSLVTDSVQLALKNQQEGKNPRIGLQQLEREAVYNVDAANALSQAQDAVNKILNNQDVTLTGQKSFYYESADDFKANPNAVWTDKNLSSGDAQELFIYLTNLQSKDYSSAHKNGIGEIETFTTENARAYRKPQEQIKFERAIDTYTLRLNQAKQDGQDLQLASENIISGMRKEFNFAQPSNLSAFTRMRISETEMFMPKLLPTEFERAGMSQLVSKYQEAVLYLNKRKDGMAVGEYVNEIKRLNDWKSWISANQQLTKEQ